MSNLHAYLYNIQKVNTQLQSYRVVCHFKGSVWDNRLWNTSMHEAAGAIKQRQISSWVWAWDSCHLSELHLQSAAILSAPLPAPLHLWKYIFRQDGSPKLHLYGTKNAPSMGSAATHTPVCDPPDMNKVSVSTLWAGLWAVNGAMLDGCSTLSSMTILLSLPIPPFLLFPCSHLIIRFSASAEWVKRNYHTYVRGKWGSTKW